MQGLVAAAANRLRIWFSGRAAAQGLVEYGVITAAVAIVGVAGLNAMTNAQRGYFTGIEDSLQPTPPSAPGALLHPTVVRTLPVVTPPPTADAPICRVGGVPTTTFTTADTVVCDTPTVYDTYGDPTDLKRPWGEVHWLLDGVRIGSCNLPHVTSPGGTNACAPPAFSWNPTVAQVGTRTLVARYCPVDDGVRCVGVTTSPSNHLANETAPLTVTIQQHIEYSFACQNLNRGGSDWAEIGRPLNCRVTLRHGGPTGPLMAGETVTWSNTSNGAGYPAFTCSTTYTGSSYTPDIRSSSACPPPVLGTAVGVNSASIVCQTDASGSCAVNFWRYYDSAGNGLSSGRNVRLTTTVSGYPGANIGQHDVEIRANFGSRHDVDGVAYCTSGDPNVFFTHTSEERGEIGTRFRVTSKITVKGTNANVTCQAVLMDKMRNPTFYLEALGPPSCVPLPAVPPNPSDCENHPNRAIAYSPGGFVNIRLGSSLPVVRPLISVPYAQTAAMFAAGPAWWSQAAGQEPFMSWTRDTIPLSGAVGTSTNLVWEYPDTPGHTWFPPSDLHIVVDFIP